MYFAKGMNQMPIMTNISLMPQFAAVNTPPVNAVNMNLHVGDDFAVGDQTSDLRKIVSGSNSAILMTAAQGNGSRSNSVPPMDNSGDNANDGNRRGPKGAKASGQIETKTKDPSLNRQWYDKFRWFFTASDKLVIGGKNREQNEEVIIECAKAGDKILHTKASGSPFTLIKSGNGEISEQDIQEAAIFCASFGKTWVEITDEIEVHHFGPEQIVKRAGQGVGEFDAEGEVGRINVKLELAITIQKGKLRAVPISSAGDLDIFFRIYPGNVSKDDMTRLAKEKLASMGVEISIQEIAQALPPNPSRF